MGLLKIAHHGSQTGTDASTFSAHNIDLAAISVGAHNRYHHPSASVLSALSVARIAYLRTDHDGSIELVSDGNAVRVYHAHNSN